VTGKLIAQGVIPRDESIVVCITGNGYKATDVVIDRSVTPVRLGRSLQEFEDYMAGRDEAVPTR
jgi:threonine synthase